MNLEGYFLDSEDLVIGDVYVYFKPYYTDEDTGGTGETDTTMKIRTFSGTYTGIHSAGEFIIFEDVYKMDEETGEFELRTGLDRLDSFEVRDVTREAIDPAVVNQRIRIMSLEDWNDNQGANNNNNNNGNAPAEVAGNTGGTGGGRRKYRKKSAKKSRRMRKLTRKR